MRKLYLFFVLVCGSFLCGAVPEEAWEIVAPYLIPDDHPIKPRLDRLFSQQRAIADRHALVAAGFENKNPEPRTGVFVVRHSKMPGYVFKIYTDDKLSYYRGEPEYLTWMLRARGAKLIRQEIKAKRWEKYFKAPKKWIYTLPTVPIAHPEHLQKNFILVEQEMDILPNAKSKKKWKDGTMTKTDLDRLYYLITKVGLRGGCKYDNIPICKDGRIAFIDTQNNLCWPLPYERLLHVLHGKMRAHWEKLTK